MNVVVTFSNTRSITIVGVCNLKLYQGRIPNITYGTGTYRVYSC